jgi:hypothetical protein
VALKPDVIVGNRTPVVVSLRQKQKGTNQTRRGSRKRHGPPIQSVGEAGRDCHSAPMRDANDRLNGIRSRGRKTQQWRGPSRSA